MVYAIQIRVYGNWVTTSVLTTEARAAASRAGVANSYGCQARVQPFSDEATAWKG